MTSEIRFPDNFLWGAATAAHQVEGNNTNSDWWLWERKTAKRKAQSATLRQAQGKQPWPKHLLEKWPTPLQEENYMSGAACDHYNRFREDFALAKELGHNAHRLSVEWSRIEPEEGVFDEKAIAHYRLVLEELRGRGLTPLVTLHHFTNPLWFAEKGGWTNARSPEYFARYAERIIKELGGLATIWTTFNEPAVVILLGYLKKFWPPQKQSRYLAWRALVHMAAAHKKAYATMQKAAQKQGLDIRVGLVYNAQAWMPRTQRFADRLMAGAINFISTYWFLDKISRSLDFLGVNYYFSSTVGFTPGRWTSGCGSEKKSDFGWEICPDGLRIVVENLWRRYKKPMYITENGVSDSRDILRSKFIIEHLAALHKAIQNGADVRGYFHWSLLDNFEWAEGFTQRFGLVEVDFPTQKRIPRKSAWLLRDIIVKNGLDSDTLQNTA